MEGGGFASDPVNDRIVWTFRLTGGEAVDSQVGWPGSFPVGVSHAGAGTTSVWSLRLSEEEADLLKGVLRGHGVNVSRWGEVEGAEQREERAVLSSAERGEVVYPTERCPSCFWLDLHSEGLCGRVSWPQPVVAEAAEAHEKARQDAASCPLSRSGSS